ncbi:glycoside hydrolase family 65 protein [Companilactobacillus huachuanensis]|uniref:Glycoside hydrolase family 65 protein n=1 Tax=Companilactobacillus huachuanensis TaxID=2559914 RepID=A0ABW1RKH4_9LACO|nr:glycosyl hydrolase family 65 protein [Companilactobacillus huachuanensis]
MNNEKIITMNDLKSNDPSYLETIFSIANGHFGVRASDPIASSDSAGTIVNGFYEMSEINYGEKAYGYAENNQTIVNLPDIRAIKIFDCDDQEFSRSELKSATLDMNTGLSTSIYDVFNPDNQAIELTLQAVLQQTDTHVLGLRYTIKAIDYTEKIKIIKHLDINNDTDETDDPRKSRVLHTVNYEKSEPDNFCEILTAKTQKSQMSIDLAICAQESLEKTVELNQMVSFDIIGLVGDINTKLEVVKTSFSEILADSKSFWHEFWHNSEVNISGDDGLNQAIHYNLFQLTSSTGRDGKTNIPAKGLSGTGYEGHYFWDTEMYMSPFFAYTNPEIARELILYRYSILSESKKRAQELGVAEGALFAWRTINGSEASAYYQAGTAQYHIDADISYAIDRYYKVTADTEFIKKYGFEIVLETARFWHSFGSYNKKGFCFFDVTGPDEYTAIVNNNYYTNRMAKFNMEFAVKLIDKFPDQAKKLGVTHDEYVSLSAAADKVYLPYSEEKQINEQDDSAFEKPIWPFEDTPKSNYPLLLHYHPLNIYRYQVNKQADTLLADFLFDDISRNQLKREYDYYEKITTHDSSLSRSIFSALAARIGLKKKAYGYFMDTVKTDLIDLQKNTADGLHVANLGGSWLTIVMGFGGISIQNSMLTIKNSLPDEWNGLSIRIRFQGRLLKIKYHHSETIIEILDGEPLDIIVDGGKKRIK